MNIHFNHTCTKLCTLKVTKVFFVDWETTSKKFVKGIKFTHSQKDLKVHIFYNKATPVNELPPDYEWIVKHPTLTDSPESSWTALISFVISFYTQASLHCHSKRCPIWPHSHVHTKYKPYLVCGEEGRYKEVDAILKYNHINVKTMNATEKTLMDLFDYSCNPCKTIFKTKEEATKHDRGKHNYLCDNLDCERSKRENGFYFKEELEDHIAGQRGCDFCPDKIFCVLDKLEAHMAIKHKKCDCSCEQYYETRDEYNEHFYSNLPLPCLEDPKCQHRFPNIEAQAFHHKTVHGSTYPYYCMACYKNAKLVYLKTPEALLDHVSEERHEEQDFFFAQIPLQVVYGVE